METLIFERTGELKRNLAQLEEKLGVKITIKGKKVSIRGPALDEYEASLVLEAINFGFPSEKSLLLKNEDVIFRRINIRSFTRRKNLEDIRSRIIGKYGTTKRTIEEVSDCYIVIKENNIGIIGSVEDIDNILTALTNLIRGSKQANIYKYLERMNTAKKEQRFKK